MLQLGMLADACQCVDMFIRFLDEESFDWADLPKRISSLRDTCHEFFGQRAVLHREGFTKAMLERVRQPIMVTLSGGQPKRLGDERGPTQGMRWTSCFARMVNWWRLAEEVLGTEFPAWHIQMAFEVFKLPRPIAMAAETKQRLTRLAKFCEVDPAALISEYDAMVPLANDVAKEMGGASCHAWARTVQRVAEDCPKASEIPLRTLAASSGPLFGLRRLLQWR